MNKNNIQVNTNKRKIIIYSLIAFSVLTIILIISSILYFLAPTFTSKQLYQTCLENKNSEGCKACENKKGGLIKNLDFSSQKTNPGNKNGDLKNLCTYCEYNYYEMSKITDSVKLEEFKKMIDNKCK